MAASIISFRSFIGNHQRKKASPEPWNNQELAELYRIADLLGRAGIIVGQDSGLSDENEPWFVFFAPESGDIVAHFARIDNTYIAVAAGQEKILKGYCFRDLIQKIIDEQPLVLPHKPHSSGNVTNLYIHPTAVLSAFVATALLYSRKVQAATDEDHSTRRNGRSTESGTTTNGVSSSHIDQGGAWILGTNSQAHGLNGIFASVTVLITSVLKDDQEKYEKHENTAKYFPQMEMPSILINQRDKNIDQFTFKEKNEITYFEEKKSHNFMSLEEFAHTIGLPKISSSLEERQFQYTPSLGDYSEVLPKNQENRATEISFSRRDTEFLSSNSGEKLTINHFSPAQTTQTDSPSSNTTIISSTSKISIVNSETTIKDDRASQDLTKSKDTIQKNDQTIIQANGYIADKTITYSDKTTTKSLTLKTYEDDKSKVIISFSLEKEILSETINVISNEIIKKIDSPIEKTLADTENINNMQTKITDNKETATSSKSCQQIIVVDNKTDVELGSGSQIVFFGGGISHVKGFVAGEDILLISQSLLEGQWHASLPTTTNESGTAVLTFTNGSMIVLTDFILTTYATGA